MNRPKNIIYKIIRESLLILMITSILSTLGGIGLESVQEKLFVYIPFLVAIPALNDMIGDFGGIVSSKFTTLLYLGKVKEEYWWRSEELRSLFRKIFVSSVFSSLYLCILATIISLTKGFHPKPLFFLKFVFLFLVITLILISIILAISILGGFYTYKKNKDPDNFLIPITTSVADLSTMLIFALIIHLVF